MLSFSGECCGRGFWGFLVKTSRPQVPPTHLWVARDGISYHSSPSCTYIMRSPAYEIWRRRRQDKNLTWEWLPLFLSFNALSKMQLSFLQVPSVFPRHRRSGAARLRVAPPAVMSAIYLMACVWIWWLAPSMMSCTNWRSADIII